MGNYAERFYQELTKSPITILDGKGTFKENSTGEEYVLLSIFLPFTANGKHLSVLSKDEDLGEDICEWREYMEGTILDFQIESIHYGISK